AARGVHGGGRALLRGHLHGEPSRAGVRAPPRPERRIHRALRHAMTGYRWDFATVLQNWPILARGRGGTLELAAASVVAGLVLGLLIGTARYSKTRLFAWPATAYVELFRNTPVLVQIMWFFFAFPIVAPFAVSPYVAATLALSLNTSAFAAEIF